MDMCRYTAYNNGDEEMTNGVFNGTARTHCSFRVVDFTIRH